MSELKERLRADMRAAMKAREGEKLSTLRMVLTEVTNAEVSGKAARELTDAEVLAVLEKEAKKRRESAETYTDAGRSELAEKERAEEQIIAAYLPAQLSDAELTEIVQAAITEAGASGMQDMGRVMKLVRPQTKGRADGSRVAAEVRSRLG
jgi:uncharacterized protein YqeY